MAIYPGAIQKLIPWANAKVQARGRKPNVFILHVAVSEAASLYGYFSNIKNESCSHFYVRKDGTIEQYIDTDIRSVADRAGNVRSISVETQGGVTRVETEQWTEAQLKSLAALAAWVNKVHGIPLVKTPDSKTTTAGVSWHRRGIQGNWTGSQKGFGWVAGEIWSGRGKSCPGLAKIHQVDDVIARAKKLTGGTTKPPVTPSKPAGKSIDQMADEVIAGKHGNGHANRQGSLGISNVEYAKVRARVNEKLSGKAPSKPAPKPKKTVNQMATEVIAGKHGNGHAKRQKSLGINSVEYAKVRNEVNRRTI